MIFVKQMCLRFPLPTYIKTRYRGTLTLIKSILDFLLRKMNPTADSSSSFSSSDPPPFDPTQPSIPISYPLKTLDELESKAYFDSFHYPFNKAKVKLQSGNTAALPDRRRILVCHDMAGGYSDDKWVQGGNNPDAYSIWHWYLMDVFVYFSHSLVTLPPPCWTNAAHKHGVKVLGTFIMEWDEGAINAKKLLSTAESARKYADRLAELARDLGFDGWLLNMEVEVEVEQISNLKEFISHLTRTMHFFVPGSLIIWYDSVTIEGKLQWQDQLNSSNKPFFDLCDGIFVNYTWKENYPKQSAEVAGDRKYDVYTGIDVFGRGTFGGGKWTTNVALDVIRENDVSAAIFAPGWVYENFEKEDFQTRQNKWWGLIEKSWGTVQKYPHILPFYSNFDQGRGYHFSVEGKQVSDTSWNNISSQTLEPFLEFFEDSKDTVQCYVDLKGESYSGGGNITFQGTLENTAYFTARLFEGELLLGNSPVYVTYSVKSNGSSLLGLVFYVSSDAKENKTLFLASRGNTLLTMNRFSSLFTNVIMPRHVTEPEREPKWTSEEFSLVIQGHVTRIDALCYKLESELDGGSEYHAVLGHIRIRTSIMNNLPPSASWHVEVPYIKWTSGSQEKNLTAKLVWELKNGNTDLFSRYNIYVKKLSKSSVGEPSEVIESVEEYLGIAVVDAFYVSDLVVPPGTSSLKFIIQVCTLDGDCQKLEESPYLQLEVEGS